MRLSVILLSILLIGGSVLAVGGLTPDLLILIALIGGVIIVLDWANMPRQAKREFREKPVSGDIVEMPRGPSITRQGALVGAVVGIIHGLIEATVFQLIFLPFFVPRMLTLLKSNPRFARFVADPRFAANLPKMLSMLNTIFAAISFVIVPFGALTGCVVGVLFVSLREHIPGRSLIRKSLVFSLILLAISFVSNLRGFLDPSAYATFGPQFSQVQLKIFAITLVEVPLLGCLFSYLLERKLKPKRV